MPKSYTFLAFFFLYSVALLYFGKSGYKETDTPEDFFVGGKEMGLFACVSTFVATWFSAASMQGLPGSIYTYGYTFVFYAVVPWFIGAIFLILLTPGLRESGALTLPEYFKLRYESKALQVASGILVIINFVLYIVIQIRGFGIVISEFLEISYPFAIFVVYIFILYTTFGGLFSVAKSDGFNFMMICVGLLIVAYLILHRIGGMGLFFEKAGAIEGYGIKGYSYFTPKGSLLHPLAGGNMPLLSLVSAFFGWGLGISTNPQYTTRIIAAKDHHTAIKMLKVSILLLLVVYVAVVIMGLGCRIIEPSVEGISSVDAVITSVINSEFASPISGFIMVSIMAAAISTANSQLLVVANSFLSDIFEILSPKPYTDEVLLVISRFVVFAAGSVSLLLAISPPESLIIYGGYIWGIFAATFLVPLYGGVFWKRGTRKAAISSMTAGFIAMVVLISYTYQTQTIFGIHPAMPGVLISAGVYYLVSRLEEGGVL